MRRALEYAHDLGVVLGQHCEDDELAAGGSMHEGEWSSRLGIAGVPAAAEEVMVARDIALVRLTGTPMHFLHLSTAGSVALVRQARAEGLPVTAEVAPHHVALTHAEAAGFDPVFKVNPPLRTGDDVAALKAGLEDGTIDAIATDHAPHPPEAKDVPFAEAPPGMLGLETALAVVCTHLVGDGTDGKATGTLSLERALAVLSWQPAAIAGLASRNGGGHSTHGGPIVEGADANLCVFDPTTRWTVDSSSLASRSRNTPFAGRELRGRNRHTVLRGEPVVVDGVAQR
jgi:dihydroorotase